MKGSSMVRVREYIPFVALAFGFLFTTVWIALMSWLPAHFLVAAAVKMFSNL
jgi:hypothetical protein